jgi:hypothetical protein
MQALALLPLLMTMGVPAADITTLARGTLSGIERPKQVAIQDEAAWRALWKEHAPEQDPPRVDFTARTVLAVFLGSRTTAGYTVDITEVERGEREAIVRVREGRPARDQMLAQVITSPFHIVSVPRLHGTIKFTHVTAP